MEHPPPLPRITMLVMTDGRHSCLEQTLESARASLYGMEIEECVMHDDSASDKFRRWLEQHFPDFTIIGGPERAGFGGAIRRSWDYIRTSEAEWVFHLEDDFTFNEPINISAICDVLSFNPHLVQMALRRQAWSDVEKLAGGVIEQHPSEYVEHTDQWDNRWLEHRLFFTTNPSVYRRTLTEFGWPEGLQSEGRFTASLLQHGAPDTAFAYWGARSDPPKVHHMGEHRVGTGY